MYSAKLRSTPTGSLSRSQREIWLISGASVGDRPVLDQLGVATDARLAAVEAVEESVTDVVAGAEAGHREDRSDRVWLELLVLRGEHVDRGWDDPDPVAVESIPDEALAREDVGVGVLARTAAGSPRLPG